MPASDVCKETMTSRERVRLALAREIPDRVPVDYDANKGINEKVAAALGADPRDRAAVKRALGCDFLGIRPKYTGRPLFGQKGGGIRVDPVSGIHTRWIEHGSGGYWDYCDFPLADARPEEIAEWPIPDPDDYDYEGCARAFAENSDMALYFGSPGLGDLINSTGMLMGMENILVALITDDEAVLTLFRRRIDWQCGVMERMLDRYSDELTFVWMGEDLGTQKGPLIGRDLYLRNIMPGHRRIAELASGYGKPVMIHSCGSSGWAFPDFIGMGISAVDTLQPEAADMSPGYLKKTYGDRLAFHGCISTAGPLAYGTPAETEEYCRRTLETMMPGGGYCFAPTHAIQDNTPLENVLAAYGAARKYGRY